MGEGLQKIAHTNNVGINAPWENIYIPKPPHIHTSTPPYLKKCANDTRGRATVVCDAEIISDAAVMPSSALASACLPFRTA